MIAEIRDGRFIFPEGREFKFRFKCKFKCTLARRSTNNGFGSFRKASRFQKGESSSSGSSVSSSARWREDRRTIALALLEKLLGSRRERVQVQVQV
jgi:hypothetical protein